MKKSKNSKTKIHKSILFFGILLYKNLGALMQRVFGDNIADFKKQNDLLFVK
ncbi:MAG: hypothetical protein ACJA0S_001005 [Rickettsiales bacterium]|jgi:hypothetical protein